MRAETALGHAALAAAVAVLLAGCDLSRLGSTNDTSSPTAVAAAPEKPAPPPVNMAGRWFLASTDGRKCAMTFANAAAANAPPTGAPGTIAPEGGCPGKFFTSRSFVFDQAGALVIRDHTGAPLGQLTMAGSSRFEGQADEGDHQTMVCFDGGRIGDPERIVRLSYQSINESPPGKIQLGCH